MFKAKVGQVHIFDLSNIILIQCTSILTLLFHNSPGYNPQRRWRGVRRPTRCSWKVWWTLATCEGQGAQETNHGQNSALSWKGFESGSWSVSQVTMVFWGWAGHGQNSVLSWKGFESWSWSMYKSSVCGMGGWEGHGQNSTLSWKGFEFGRWSVSQVSVSVVLLPLLRP